MNTIKNTDASILMEFREAVKDLKGLPTGELTAQMGVLGRPYLDRLQANGHELRDAIGLMRSVWVGIEKGV